MPRSLFRKEAIDAQREKFLGEASVAQPVRMWVYTATACTIAVLAVAVAVWGQYTRRERVQGYLTSAVGAADVRMPDAGSVSEISVKEGDVVKAGTKLFRLTVDRSGAGEAASYQTVIGELKTQVDLLKHNRDNATKQGQQHIAQQKQRIDNLQKELGELGVAAKLQTERVDQARKLLDKWVDLKAKDYASEYYILQYQKELKDQEIKAQEIERQRASIRKDVDDARASLPSVALQAQSEIDQVSGTISKAEQSIADQVRTSGERKREMVVVAPIDGTVTNIGPATGQTVAADAKFATILPTSPLHAELLVPTRAIGFVKPGQTVTMRYEAFPYERFGQYSGKVGSVGKDVWTPGASVGPLSVHEPVYRIVVDIDRQDIVAGDQRFPLRAGMVLSADLLMERRSLLEWLFQPMIQLRKRMTTETVAAS